MKLNDAIITNIYDNSKLNTNIWFQHAGNPHIHTQPISFPISCPFFTAAVDRV